MTLLASHIQRTRAYTHKHTFILRCSGENNWGYFSGLFSTNPNSRGSECPFLRIFMQCRLMGIPKQIEPALSAQLRSLLRGRFGKKLFAIDTVFADVHQNPKKIIAPHIPSEKERRSTSLVLIRVRQNFGHLNVYFNDWFAFALLIRSCPDSGQEDERFLPV